MTVLKHGTESEVTMCMIRKAYEVIADTLRDHIRQGEWPEGTRLPSVEQLAQRHGVGRSTIREALMSLKTQGWVDVRHGGGTFVLRTSEPLAAEAPEIESAEQLREWLELRFILETESAALAASRRSEADLTGLRDILADMGSSNEEALLEKADAAFHLGIARAAGNGLLVRTLEGLFLSMGSVMRESRRLWLFAERSESDRLYEEHLSILDAVERQEASLARERMSAHLRKVEQVLHQLQFR
ncbi:FadR/GntR family transcriptional regulator [Paenibacillus silviterrae]|uniref:FadR/GntR family transcriptional regulator n=1 Tax=Paenibacillus silviterrae TaxID=3242194 RepID=UPI002543BC96|nr:FadR/GntR family transcriptional regulator [Paenibacillus chinjuensis]